MLDKFFSGISADGRYREYLICLFLTIPLCASLFPVFWNSFSKLEDEEMNGFAVSLLSSTPRIKWGNITERACFEGDNKSLLVQDLTELRKEKGNYWDTRLEKTNFAQEIALRRYGKLGWGILPPRLLFDAIHLTRAGLM